MQMSHQKLKNINLHFYSEAMYTAYQVMETCALQQNLCIMYDLPSKMQHKIIHVALANLLVAGNNWPATLVLVLCIHDVYIAQWVSHLGLRY